MANLKQLEIDNPNIPIYKNAFEKSKLVGIGSYLKKVEEEKKVNALLLLSIAQHESQYGLSDRAQKSNNFFGIGIHDDKPNDIYFTSIEENIDRLIDGYFNKNYISPNARFAHGAVLGKKSLGINVWYASDPYWGAKAAGHWYRIDKAMGGKDIAKAYRVGITTDALKFE